MTRTFRPALLALACLATAVGAEAVKPPPRPPGSHLVRTDPGMSEPERKRYVRAHHHKFHHGKDYTRDDSIHGHESQSVVRTNAPVPGAAAPGAGTRPGNAPGGAGTGPARERTDQGASSWFSGETKDER